MSDRLVSASAMCVIEDHIRNERFDAIDQLVSSIDWNNAGLHLICGVVRSTARIKQHLPSWEKSFELAQQQVIKRGREPKHLFVGML